ncbi:MAG: PEP-CTERM sorting domain-containing protein [Solirubrobacterales bacterium]|nr:PEP-CTERM sorting domain-containing protein [Solirubrobacterales bacterium]
MDITEIAVVPEPGSGLMIGAGLLVLGALARRTRARS